MKIYDCFQFFDEEMLLDLRLNIMDKYIDKFVITEATYTHSGNPKKLIFDINKFAKFKDKIIYIVVDKTPPDLLIIDNKESLNERQSKMILNAKKRETYQINMTQEAITNANPDDIIIVSDLDEIPNLEKIDFKIISQKLIFFKQKMFYYKLNLFHKSFPWYGSKACKKKYFKTPERLRSIKNKKYPMWRFDILFSKFKYNDIYFAMDGGWHFSFLKKPKDISIKIKSYAHQEFYKDEFIDEEKITKRIQNNQDIFDRNIEYKRVDLDQSFPKYILNNKAMLGEWILE